MPVGEGGGNSPAMNRLEEGALNGRVRGVENMKGRQKPAVATHVNSWRREPRRERPTAFNAVAIMGQVQGEEHMSYAEVEWEQERQPQK